MDDKSGSYAAIETRSLILQSKTPGAHLIHSSCGGVFPQTQTASIMAEVKRNLESGSITKKSLRVIRT